MRNLRLAFIPLLLLPLLALTPPESQGAVYSLQAAATTLTMPDGTAIPMWGFADVTPGSGDGIVRVPGPVLSVSPGDTTLVINLTNNLPVPISIVIPGQPVPLAPTYFDDGKGNRVRSFNTEVPAMSGPVQLTFSGLQPGTYLYESGTNQGMQIPMGLYGALVVRPAAGQAYNAATAFDQEEVVLFSEIDPVFNAAVSAGASTPGFSRSSIDYAPRYFLLNGAAYPRTLEISAPVGKKTLVRLLNAGSRNYVPTVSGSFMDTAAPPNPRALTFQVAAGDGKLLPYPRYESALILSAGKTLDAFLDLTTASTPGYYPLFDRSSGSANNGSSPGGMLTFVRSDLPGKNCSPLKGDASGDGIITLADALLALRGLVNNTFVPSTMDVDPDATTGLPCGNGVAEITDVLLILRKAFGMNPY